MDAQCNRGCYNAFRGIAIGGMTAAQALSAMHAALSRVLLGLITILVLLAGAAPAWAHGPKPPATTAAAAEKPAEPIELPAVDIDGYRLRGSVLQGSESEIEIRIDRHIDPPDPILGAYGPASDVEVTMTLLRGGAAVAAPQKAHAESDAGVYGIHVALVPAGSYVLHVELATSGAATITADLPFAIAASAPTAVAAEPSMEMDMTHPFLAHMGMPDPPGSASVRVTGIERSSELGRGGDVAIHVEAGVLPNLGVHLRNDSITGAKAGNVMEAAEDHGSELMVMYAFLTDTAKTRALSVFAELSWPSMKGNMKPVNGGGGIAGRYQWTNRFLFDADVHVVPEGGTVELEFESSAQVRPAGRTYGILELRGNTGGGGETKVYLLPAIKVGLGRSNGAVGLGLQFPLTQARDYDRQAMFQLDWDF